MIKTSRRLVRRRNRAVALFFLVASGWVATPFVVGGWHDRGITADSNGADSQRSPEDPQVPHDEVSCGICQIIHSPNLSVASAPLLPTLPSLIPAPVLDNPTPGDFAIDANDARAPPQA